MEVLHESAADDPFSTRGVAAQVGGARRLATGRAGQDAGRERFRTLLGGPLACDARSMPRSESISYFALTTFRLWFQPFGIKQADRRSHMYVIGKTGTGKSTLLETLMAQDIDAGRGFALLDPHGDLLERVLNHVPVDRYPDVVYFNVPDGRHPVAFNPLEWVQPDHRLLAASGMLEACKKLWPDYWGPRLEHVLRNAFLLLVEQPQAILADVLRLFRDKDYRQALGRRCQNPILRQFWLSEFENYSWRYRADSIAPIQSKIGAFLADPKLQAILGQPKSAFNIREVMDDGKILLVNLAKGKLGEDAAALMGSLLLSRIGLAALSRADQPEETRRDFHLYLDEFQTFTTLSLATMLSEVRKYRVNLVMAHQYLSQLEPEVRDAVLANAGTLISFRLGAPDAGLIAQELAPDFEPVDLIRLPNYNIYLKLMIDGAPSRPFSAKTIAVERDAA